VIGPRRRAPGKRWSATSSIECYDRAGARRGAGQQGDARKVVVRYRLDGRSKSSAFSGPGR